MKSYGTLALLLLCLAYGGIRTQAMEDNNVTIDPLDYGDFFDTDGSGMDQENCTTTTNSTKLVEIPIGDKCDKKNGCISKLTVTINRGRALNYPIILTITIRNKKGIKEKLQIKFTSRYNVYKNEIIFHDNECVKIKDICEITIAHQTGSATVRNIDIKAAVCINGKVEKVTLVTDRAIKFTNTKEKPLTLVCQ